MDLPAGLLGLTIERGSIFHSNIFENIDHGKFFVVVGVSETEVVGFFFINTKINEYIKNKPNLLGLQYELNAKDYAFLDHDSYLSCSNLITRKKTDIVESIAEGRTTIKGTLSETDIKEVLQVVRHSKVFSEATKRVFFH
jgi:hypothetical protein